jgi:hypothetical protein
MLRALVVLVFTDKLDSTGTVDYYRGADRQADRVMGRGYGEDGDVTVARGTPSRRRQFGQLTSRRFSIATLDSPFGENETEHG